MSRKPKLQPHSRFFLQTTLPSVLATTLYVRNSSVSGTEALTNGETHRKTPVPQDLSNFNYFIFMITNNNFKNFFVTPKSLIKTHLLLSNPADININLPFHIINEHTK